VMIRQCQELDLNVLEADFLDFLTAQKPHSFQVITGFHIIEHLPLETAVLLLDEIFRVLLPGGILILETPNPLNLIVGACNFYIDPTHKTPIYPYSLIFTLEQRGFSDCILLKLHPVDALSIDDSMHESLKTIVSYFNESQDFSVICKKLF
jgi:SAM-dependent methyltransferase